MMEILPTRKVLMASHSYIKKSNSVSGLKHDVSCTFIYYYTSTLSVCFLKTAFWSFPFLFITDETHADTCELYIRRKIVFETNLPAVLQTVLKEDFEV